MRAKCAQRNKMVASFSTYLHKLFGGTILHFLQKNYFIKPCIHRGEYIAKKVSLLVAAIAMLAQVKLRKQKSF